MNVLTEDDVKEILKQRDLILEGLRMKRYDIHKLMMDEDAFLRSLALPTMNLDSMGGPKGVTHDISDFLLEYQEQVRKRTQEYHYILRQIAEKEQMVHKVWACFSQLPEPYYSILHKIYVDGQPYKTVELESGYSHQVFNKHRKKAIDTICMLFDYNTSMADGVPPHENRATREAKKVFGRSGHGGKHKEMQADEQYRQLTLDLFEGPEIPQKAKDS